MEMLSTADEDQIQNLKDILSEVEQLQASCVNISDIEKTHN